jgi:hypothetical protein
MKGLTKGHSPYRLGESLKADNFVKIFILVVLMVCVMSMVMKMGMSSPAVIRAAIRTKKYR